MKEKTWWKAWTMEKIQQNTTELQLHINFLITHKRNNPDQGSGNEFAEILKQPLIFRIQDAGPSIQHVYWMLSMCWRIRAAILEALLSRKSHEWSEYRVGCETKVQNDDWKLYKHWNFIDVSSGKSSHHRCFFLSKKSHEWADYRIVF